MAFLWSDDAGILGLVLVLVAIAGIGFSLLDLVVGKSGIRVDRLGIHRQGIRKADTVIRWDDVADVVIGTNRQGHSELQALMTDGGTTDLGINRPAWRSRVIRYFRHLV